MSNFRRIVLHAGLSKTGSTSIQQTCSLHRDILREHGIDYPRLDVDGHGGRNHSLALVLAVADEPARYILGLAQRYGDALPRMHARSAEQLHQVLADGGDTLLLSTELVENFTVGDMQSLRALLRAQCDDLRVLASFRSPLDSVESLLQERLKAGAVLEPGDLVGRTRRKFENLVAGFPRELRPLNYHVARNNPLGLVAAFMEELGLPQDVIETMDLRVENARMSAECYQLMRAINLAWPRREQDRHGVQRTPQDLNVLLSLPGAPFQLEQIADAGFQAACAEETRWLEKQLGFEFPAPRESVAAPLWQQSTLAELPALLRQLPAAELRASAADFLRDESAALVAARPETASALGEIADGVS